MLEKLFIVTPISLISGEKTELLLTGCKNSVLLCIYLCLYPAIVLTRGVMVSGFLSVRQSKLAQTLIWIQG